MDIFLKILLILFCLIIFIQDFRERAVYWVYFPFSLIALVLIGILDIGVKGLLMNFLLNTLILVSILGLVYFYFLMRYKTRPGELNKFIGLGDILFFIICSLAFSSLNFILFMNFSLILTLIVFIPIVMKNRPDTYKIPLAGMQALLLSIIQGLTFIQSLNIDPFIDNIMFNLH